MGLGGIIYIHYNFKIKYIAHIVELPFCEPGNDWSSKVFLLNHIDYVSLN